MEDFKTIEINQAYYGEVSRSHGCIATSLNEDNLNSYLTAFSDKPYPIPVGITLTKYYSAAVFNEWFIFTKTIPDETASRPGMVFTHALVIKLADIEKINDLKQLFAHFTQDIPVNPSTLSVITYTDSPKLPQSLTNEYPKYIQQTVKQIIKGQKVAFFGELDNFAETIFAIWNGLPVQLREYFIFTIGFSLSDIESKKEPILFFQKQLAARIEYAGSVNVDSTETTSVTEDGERLILGHRHLNDFEAFLAEINCKLTDFNQLTKAERAYTLYKRIETLLPDDLRQLIRLTAILSPSKQDGVRIKTTVIDKLVKFIDAGKDYKIKALRNLSLECFLNAEALLSLSITNFIINQFRKVIPIDLDTINDLVEVTDKLERVNWWNKAVIAGLDQAISNVDSIDFIWEMLTYDKTKLESFFSLLASGDKIEKRLISCAPELLDTAVIIRIKHFIKQEKWNALYAHLSLKHLQPQAALKEQLLIEKGLSLGESGGTLLIASKVSDEKLVELCLTHDDDKLLELLTVRITEKPILLNKLDLNNARWIEIWNATLKESNNLEKGVLDIGGKANELYDLILRNHRLPETLMSLLSSSSYADLSKYPRRKEFWSVVSTAYKQAFMQATALGYRSKIAIGLPSSEEIEPELLTVMSSDQFVSSYLSAYRDDLNAVINYFEAIPNLKDQFLADYINYYAGKPSELGAARLGNLVSARNYKKSASAIFHKSKGKAYFRIALNKVTGLLQLGLFDKVLYGSLFGETLGEETAYSALFEIVKDLYKKGPEDSDIWERAGGEESKFINQNSREENWRRALHLLRYGGAGKNISIKSLLKEINSDFGGNEIVKELQNYFKNSK